jgi:hypothetical protein
MNLYTKITSILSFVYSIWFGFNFYKLHRVEKLMINTNKLNLSVLIFSIVVLLSFRYGKGLNWIDELYFSTLSTLFLPIGLNFINGTKKYIVFILLGAVTSAILFHEIFIQVELLLSLLIILYKSKQFLVGAAQQRGLAITFLLIAFFYFLTILQYAIFKIDFKLNKSIFIVYYSYFYLTVLILLYVSISTRFRRLFFV